MISWKIVYDRPYTRTLRSEAMCFLNIRQTGEGEGEVVVVYGCVGMFWDMNVRIYTFVRLPIVRLSNLGYYGALPISVERN